MLKILADSTLPHLERLFSKAFELSTFASEYEAIRLLPMHDILICRSTLKVTPSLLNKTHIQCVATASSGTDHIHEAYLLQHNIKLFDAKGANANAVADYVLSTLAYLEQHHLLTGFKAGIIGMGKVGTEVFKRLKTLGFEVLCYDPLITPQDKQHIHVQSLDDLQKCDLIAIHANWHKTQPFPSHLMLNEDFLSKLKNGTTILNAARGNIVDEDAILKTKGLRYCTDVYANEPEINPNIIDFATLCTPHIAGHSIEGKYRAIELLSHKIHAHYNLPFPPSLPLTSLGPLPESKWQECALNLYNPYIDTQILKTAFNKTNAFLVQRKEHCFRHDYVLYDTDSFPTSIQGIFGTK